MRSYKPSRSKLGKQQRKYNIMGFLFALPFIVGFLAYWVYPMLLAAYHSFTKYNVFTGEALWVGLKNYNKLTNDAKFYKSLSNTMYMSFLGMPVSVLMALALAMLLNMQKKAKALFRTVYYLPTVVPIVASSMLFISILNPQTGFVNLILKYIGVYGPSWLSDPKFTKVSLIMMDSWRCGGTMIIFLAALNAVPQPLYDSADIDGANSFVKFFKITLPAISPSILFAFVMGFIYSFQYFTQAFVFATTGSATSMATTTGGPENSLLFYSIYLYQQAFTNLEFGYASALAVILFVIIFVISQLILKLSQRNVVYDLE